MGIMHMLSCRGRAKKTETETETEENADCSPATAYVCGRDGAHACIVYSEQDVPADADEVHAVHTGAVTAERLLRTADGGFVLRVTVKALPPYAAAAYRYGTAEKAAEAAADTAAAVAAGELSARPGFALAVKQEAESGEHSLPDAFAALVRVKTEKELKEQRAFAVTGMTVGLQK